MERPEIIPPSARHESRRRMAPHRGIGFAKLSPIYFFAVCALFVGIHLHHILKESEPEI
ncbi:MAG TPA: hypothetical protein VG844_01995 [Terracidiphilus sp.]|nr:hypothetical protein [Terracidiphilus sp.]